MLRLAIALGLIAAGAAAMALWLTRWHDDREYLTPDHRQLLDINVSVHG